MRRPDPAARPLGPASAAGHIWQLTLIGGKSANVTLMRFFKIRANS
jgi:hypothetical protein